MIQSTVECAELSAQLVHPILKECVHLESVKLLALLHTLIVMETLLMAVSQTTTTMLPTVVLLVEVHALFMTTLHLHAQVGSVDGSAVPATGKIATQIMWTAVKSTL